MVFKADGSVVMTGAGVEIASAIDAGLADLIAKALTAFTAFAVGRKVICNGYPGTVTKVCSGQLQGMVEVRVPGGEVCVGAIELARFNDEAHRAKGHSEPEPGHGFYVSGGKAHALRDDPQEILDDAEGR